MISRVNVSIPFVALVLLVASSVHAQAPARARPEPPKSARESAALDLTGQWVSIVNEDWRWRMVTPPKGDTTSVQPLNAAGKALADQWDPSEDGSCRAFGAAGVMRMPTRLRIDWDGDEVLTVRTDAGEQLRRFEFASKGDGGAPSLQGHSLASWQRTLPPAGPRGAAPPGGSLKVVTQKLLPGWLRRNGVPYSADTTLTAFSVRRSGENGNASNSIRPASSFEKSRMSFKRRSKCAPDWSMASTSRLWSGSRRVSNKVVASPRTALSGVRISWLIVARNSDFALFSLSAQIGRAHV